MSEGYVDRATLVTADSNRYDRGMDTVVALGIVSFVLGMVTLVDLVGLGQQGAALGESLLVFLAVVVGATGLVGTLSYANVVPITSRRLRGTGIGVLVSVTGLTVAAYALEVTLATLLGVTLLVQAGAVASAGITSRLGLVDTQPGTSAGLLAGSAFGFIGLLIGAVAAGTLVGFDSPLWIVIAVAGGVGMTAVTALPREDLGSTMPPVIVVGLFGGTIVTGLLGIGWQWNPDVLDGGLTGGVVIPIFVLFGSLLSAWAAAKSRAGFGAQGRQYGAYLIVNLNAFFILATMTSLVAFVLSKGFNYVLHGFTIGAVSIAVLLSPVLVVTIDWARRPAGSDAWHSGARQLFRVLPVAAVGSLYAGLAWVLATGSDLTREYQYPVLVNRVEEQMDTTAGITSDPAVGAWLLTIPALILFTSFYRSAGGLPRTGAGDDTFGRVQAAIPLVTSGLMLFAVALALLGTAPLGVPVGGTLGFAVVVSGAAGALALGLAPLAAFAAGGSLPDLLADRPESVTARLYGPLAILVGIVVLEPAAGVVPTVGPVDVVPVVALVGVAVSLWTAIVLGRTRDGPGPDTGRTGTRVATLGLAAAAGFVALIGLHVGLAGSSFEIGPIAVATEGSLSWPFAMESKIPLAPDNGGIFPAIMGTVWLVIGASAIAVPLGVSAAIFLTEYAEQGRFTAVVETATNALWSTPSIVFGLFGFAFLVQRINGDLSLLSGMLVLGFMLLPLVLITSREAIKAVPDEYRDASAALGVNRWKTIRSVVLPAAMPGVITGVILGVGRIAGETAPLILVMGSRLSSQEAVDVLGGFKFLGGPPFIVNEALLAKPPALPTGIWAVIAAGVSGSSSRGWATAFLLLTVVLTFYMVGITTRTYFRRKLNYE
jgi:phosphate transport system permease protein